ncbi:hypothetical protein CPAR01_14185 [Colletotrichum paranaense]|uniref:Uncharacterized protein n=2 Tax=Colletotrichum acutatum species complex TaxID=2707335 RepID=A0AAI9UQ95_9PEZI|nr:uncharacterized protein CPAR01_14185 [Colletotrichum paranaense]KAK1462714.1 hypothetical protein CMEL01_13825 [Colletotrichum melonis]KAK1523332.1 hypothetical protein CPAR01_14185 [Colletotrichum paranaense]
MALTSPNYSQSQSSSADERGDELKLGGAWRPFVVMLLPTPPQNALPGPRRNKPSPAQTQTFSPPSGSSSSANPPFWRREHKIQATCLFPPPSSPLHAPFPPSYHLTRVPIPWHRVQTQKKRKRRSTLPYLLSKANIETKGTGRPLLHLTRVSSKPRPGNTMALFGCDSLSFSQRNKAELGE